MAQSLALAHFFPHFPLCHLAQQLGASGKTRSLCHTQSANGVRYPRLAHPIQPPTYGERFMKRALEDYPLAWCNACQTQTPHYDAPKNTACVICTRRKSNEWRLANLEASNDRARRWVQENRDQHNNNCRQWTIDNPEKYDATQKRHSRKRRAQKTNVDHVPYDDQYIFDRDRWICHLCDLAIDPSVSRKSGDGATIDHIIPLSLGGSDAPDNVAAAHWRCNFFRNTRSIESVRQWIASNGMPPDPPVLVPGELSTHWSKGHEYTEENTYVNPNTGRRQCRICRRDYKRAQNRRQRFTDGGDASAA